MCPVVQWTLTASRGKAGLVLATPVPRPALTVDIRLLRLLAAGLGNTILTLGGMGLGATVLTTGGRRLMSATLVGLCLVVSSGGLLASVGAARHVDDDLLVRGFGK